MGMLDSFWKWLTTSDSIKKTKGHPDLYPIDVDKLSKELNLVNEATRLGEAGLPSPDAKTHSGIEAAIVQRVEKARQDYVDWAGLRLNILNGDIAKRKLTETINRASQADKEFERKASALLTEQDSVIRALGTATENRKIELDAFRAKNGIAREADYPTTGGAYLRYGLLFLLILIEGFLNSAFFAKGLDTGLLGGFMYAGILATMNVLIAFSFGKFAIRYINHSNAGLKGLGFLGLLLSMTVMVAMGFGIAHFRDGLTTEVADPARAALQAILASPFQLRDFFSWALFVISISFGVISLFDGLFSDDLYPRYGSISRRTQEAIDDYGEEIETLQSDLEHLKNEELKFLDNAVQQSQASVAVLDSLINDKRMAGSRLLTALRDADYSLEALLLKFRTENELHRKGVQRPEYFNQQPDLLPLQNPDFSTKQDEAVLAEQSDLVRSLLAEVQEIRSRIQTAFNHQFDRLKPLATHFPGKEVT